MNNFIDIELTPGMRVALKQDFDCYPFFDIRAGVTGVITVIDESIEGGLVAVRLDERIEELDEWDNEIHLHASYWELDESANAISKILNVL